MSSKPSGETARYMPDSFFRGSTDVRTGSPGATLSDVPVRYENFFSRVGKYENPPRVPGFNGSPLQHLVKYFSPVDKCENRGSGHPVTVG